MSPSSTAHERYTFTRTDRRRLARALARLTRVREYRRVQAVWLVAEGAPIQTAAHHVRAPRRTVHRWVARYCATQDPAALADRPRRGRPRQVRPTARQLTAALRRDPRTLGYAATTWTVALLAHYCADHLGCPITPRTLRRRLHELDYRWKRPRYAYRDRARHLAQKKGDSAAA
jgi:transposase